MSELRTNRIVPRDGLPSGSAGGIIQVRQKVITDTYSESVPPGNSGPVSYTHLTLPTKRIV